LVNLLRNPNDRGYKEAGSDTNESGERNEPDLVLSDQLAQVSFKPQDPRFQPPLEAMSTRPCDRADPDGCDIVWH
jgi:hypothetical protein